MDVIGQAVIIVPYNQLLYLVFKASVFLNLQPSVMLLLPFSGG